MKTQNTKIVIKRLQYAINAIEIANKYAINRKNYLIGTCDIDSINGAIKRLVFLENKILKMKNKIKK